MAGQSKPKSEHPSTAKTLRWYEIWFMSLLHPNENTFIRLLAEEPNSSINRTYNWLYLGTLGSTWASLNFFAADEAACLPIGLALVILLPVTLVIFLIQSVSMVLFGGKGTREQLVYSFSTYLAPIGILIGILSFVPFLKYLTIVLIIYALFLALIAIKTVNQFGWGKALLSCIVVFSAISLLFWGFHNVVTSEKYQNVLVIWRN